MLNLIHAMSSARVTKLFFSATAAVYGEPQTLPITEDAPIRPINSYGVSKAVCESLIERVCKASQLYCVTFRYSNAAGPTKVVRPGKRMSQRPT